MKIRFLGTSGWYDTVGNGNTVCTLLETKDAYIVFDFGFGAHKLDKYIKDDRPIYIFLSHFHMDHVCGFHVMPKFNFKQGVTIIYQDVKENRAVLKTLSSPPLCASFDYYGFSVKTLPIKVGGHTKPVEFECLPLKHTTPCLGYRIYVEGKVVTYCCDTAPCENGIRLAQGADVLIHECTILSGDSDLEWGHSNSTGVAQVAKQAGAKKLVLTHFGADCFDSVTKKTSAEKLAQKIFTNTIASKDGMVIKL